MLKGLSSNLIEHGGIFPGFKNSALSHVSPYANNLILRISY